MLKHWIIPVISFFDETTLNKYMYFVNFISRFELFYVHKFWALDHPLLTNLGCGRANYNKQNELFLLNRLAFRRGACIPNVPAANICIYVWFQAFQNRELLKKLCSYVLYLKYFITINKWKRLAQSLNIERSASIHKRTSYHNYGCKIVFFIKEPNQF